MLRPAAVLAVLALLVAGCGGDDGGGTGQARSPTTTATAEGAGTATTTAPTTAAPSSGPTAPAGPVVATIDSAGTRLAVTEVARGLDTVWSLAWDPQGALWYTERGGRVTRLGDAPQHVAGVEEAGEGGLMGLEIDGRGRRFVMYTSDRDNRIVQLEADGSQRVLVDGIAKASIHNGGRLRFGPDGALYATTGDAGRTELAPDPASLSGKVLRLDPDGGAPAVHSRGRRNPQGLCFAPDGRLLATEHGPRGGDEVDVITPGSDGGWPRTAGNGIRNYTPSVAPTGCVVYDAAAIPAWRGSMLFTTLAGRALRRLTFGAGGGVAGEEVLLAGRFGRLRDVAVGPDGAVYVATSNRDGRGSPREGDDRILRIAPAG